MSQSVRPDPPNAIGRRWRLAGRTWNSPHHPKSQSRGTPPNHQTEQQPARRLTQRPSPGRPDSAQPPDPPHVGAPAFSSPPAGGQNLPTGLYRSPQQKIGRYTGLRAGARVSKASVGPRTVDAGASFRAHAGNVTSTANSTRAECTRLACTIVGLSVSPYKKDRFYRCNHTTTYSSTANSNCNTARARTDKNSGPTLFCCCEK